MRYLYATLTGRLNGVSGSNNFDTASRQYKQAGALVELDAQTVGGFYGQDSWRITPHLAINAGFRWQMSGALHTPTPQYTQPTIADLFGPSTAPFQPGTLNGVANPMLYAHASTYSADLREPAPNAGFAWNPAMLGGRLVVRGGAAISYYDEGWEPWEEAAIFYNPGVKQTISLASNTPGSNQPAGKYSAGSLLLGNSISPLLTPATYDPPYAESAFTFKSTFYGTDPNLKTPQVQNWNLGVQYKIGWDTVVEANYVGNHVIHMWQNFNINEPNIFENGFLAEFQNAQTNYAASGGKSFTGSNTPIMNQAFNRHFGRNQLRLPQRCKDRSGRRARQFARHNQRLSLQRDRRRELRSLRNPGLHRCHRLSHQLLHHQPLLGGFGDLAVRSRRLEL